MDRFMFDDRVNLWLGSFGFFGSAFVFRKLRIQTFAKGEDSNPVAIMEASIVRWVNSSTMTANTSITKYCNTTRAVKEMGDTFTALPGAVKGILRVMSPVTTNNCLCLYVGPCCSLFKPRLYHLLEYCTSLSPASLPPLRSIYFQQKLHHSTNNHHRVYSASKHKHLTLSKPLTLMESTNMNVNQQALEQQVPDTLTGMY